jgi:hypothetical protein
VRIGTYTHVRNSIIVASILFISGCGQVAVTHGNGGNGGTGGGGSGGTGGSGGGVGGGGGAGGGGGGGGSGVAGDAGVTFTIYAHSDTTLYTVDTVAKTLITVGAFNAPIVGAADMGSGGKADVIQDLAITPDNKIYVVSKTTLYTADPKDGHVTPVGAVGSLKACGTDNVALTTTPDGKLYSADYSGSFCEIDVTVNPPAIKVIGQLGSGMAISGDIVGLGDGSIYGTAYLLADKSNMGTQINNVLIKLDPKTGAMTQNIGPTGYPKLFGVAFDSNLVYGFTHDGTGDVVIIDPKTGKGTLFNSFKDSGGMGIRFGGAGVNSTVPPPPIS